MYPFSSAAPFSRPSRNGVEPVVFFFFTYIFSLFADATLLALRAVEFAPIANVDRTSMFKFLRKDAVHL